MLMIPRKIRRINHGGEVSLRLHANNGLRSVAFPLSNTRTTHLSALRDVKDIETVS